MAPGRVTTRRRPADTESCSRSSFVRVLTENVFCGGAGSTWSRLRPPAHPSTSHVRSPTRRSTKRVAMGSCVPMGAARSPPRLPFGERRNSVPAVPIPPPIVQRGFFSGRAGAGEVVAAGAGAGAAGDRAASWALEAAGAAADQDRDGGGDGGGSEVHGFPFLYGRTHHDRLGYTCSDSDHARDRDISPQELLPAVALVLARERGRLLRVGRRAELPRPRLLRPAGLAERRVVARHRRQAEPVHRHGVGGDRVQPVDVDEPLRQEDRRGAEPLLRQVAHQLRVVDAHLPGEEGAHEIDVALLERGAEEVEAPAVAPLVGRVLRERRPALEHAAPEDALAHERRLLRGEPGEEVAVHLEEVGAARGHVDRDRALAELDVALVGDVAGEVLGDDPGPLLRLGVAGQPDPEHGEHRLALAVERGEDVPEPLVVGEGVDLPLAEARALAERDAGRAGGGVGGEARPDEHLHVAAEERSADLSDLRRGLLCGVAELLVARARARGPGAGDGEVVYVVVGEAVARVAVDPARELVEALDRKST